jgi:hypothetical protein
MRRETGVWMLAGAAILTACDGGSPTSTAPMAVSLAIEGPAVVALSPGDLLPLRAAGLDGRGEEVPLDVRITWSSDSSSPASVDATGVVSAGDELGLGWVFAEADTDQGHLRDSVGVWIQLPESTPSRFRISLIFIDDVPEKWQDMMRVAARRWEEVIRDTLPLAKISDLPSHCAPGFLPEEALSGTEQGMRVTVRVSDFPPGGAHAAGASCLQRGAPHPTTVVGSIALNRAYLHIDDADFLSYVAHHELGHTLGLVGLMGTTDYEWIDGPAGLYRGYLARFGRSLDTGGEIPDYLSFDGAHWGRGIPDVMGWDDTSINNVSVGALMDLGYPAAWYGAGPTGPE